VTHRAARYAKVVARLAGAIVAGLLLALAQGLHPVWWALWLAPLPLLAATLTAGPRTAWAVSLGAGLIGMAPLASYYIEVALPVGAVVIIALSVLELAALVQLVRGAAARGAGWTLPFAFPLGAAALDALIRNLSPHGTAGSWAYSQMAALPVIQAAALGGTAAVLFLPTLAGSTLAVAVVYRERVRRPLLTYGLPALIIAAGVGFGLHRLQGAGHDPTIPVALGAIDGLKTPATGAGGAGDPTLAAYLGLFDRLAVPATADRPALVLFPEKIETFTSDEVRAAKARFAEEARRTGVTIVVGEAEIARPLWLNRAWAFGPDGREVAPYAKHHPVPGLEARFASATGLSTLKIAGRRFGLEICKDLDFDAPSRDYARLGVAAVIVPAWDFGRDAYAHDRMAVLRGVEFGFGVIRSAREGLLTVSDRFGRVVAERPSREGQATGLATAAPLGSGAPTPYGRVGDLFGWTCLGLLLLVRFRSRRPRSA
jgi:apolipoprotein N-acyltransferase